MCCSETPIFGFKHTHTTHITQTVRIHNYIIYVCISGSNFVTQDLGIGWVESLAHRYAATLFYIFPVPKSIRSQQRGAHYKLFSTESSVRSNGWIIC